MGVRLPYEKKGEKGGTHDVGMIEALEDPHLAPYALFIALDPFLRYGLQGDLASDVLRHRIGRAGSARKYGRTFGGRGGCRRRRGRTSLAALDVPCGALDHRVGKN